MVLLHLEQLTTESFTPTAFLNANKKPQLMPGLFYKTNLIKN
ncbi:hypothetical protein PCARR_a2922 [Pseudoalteromonas carrageenovora IAM 12662]|uniref:Uncharacterized protein n=1 Tax=Pseudoalteromonas carrageenovora IAM 12662 TaxID=1314868 RepID=A0ABR9EKV5_PSEVC|nr:hypothetical protein [Pseudoalteromonas carrageenovora IAM 12662]